MNQSLAQHLVDHGWATEFNANALVNCIQNWRDRQCSTPREHADVGVADLVEKLLDRYPVDPHQPNGY